MRRPVMTPCSECPRDVMRPSSWRVHEGLATSCNRPRRTGFAVQLPAGTELLERRQGLADHPGVCPNRSFRMKDRVLRTVAHITKPRELVGEGRPIEAPCRRSGTSERKSTHANKVHSGAKMVWLDSRSAQWDPDSSTVCRITSHWSYNLPGCVRIWVRISGARNTAQPSRRNVMTMYKSNRPGRA